MSGFEIGLAIYVALGFANVYLMSIGSRYVGKKLDRMDWIIGMVIWPVFLALFFFHLSRRSDQSGGT